MDCASVTIVPLTGSLDQGFDEIATGAAVPARAAGPLDLIHAVRPVRDGGLDRVIGDAAAETEDHRRGLRRTAGDSIIRVAFRSLLGSCYDNV